MAASAYDAVARELKSLVEAHGRALLGERRRLIGLLLDHLPDLRREIRAVATAIDEGVAAALAGVDRPLAGLTIDRQSARLEEDAALRPDVARGVTRAIAHALGLGPEPGVYASPPPPPPPPAPPATPQPIYGQYQSSSPPKQGVLADPKAMRAAIIGGALAVAGAVILVPKIVPTQATPVVATPTAPAPPVAGTTAGIGDETGKKAQAGYAGELVDYRVSAQKTLQANVGSPTPLDIPVGRRVTTEEVRAIRTREKGALLIDVLANPHPQTIDGAHYLAQAGSPGDFEDAIQMQLRASLAALTNHRKTVPIVFFCIGAQCWESYNAALRAHELGYTDIRWYRGGLASWAEARLPMRATPAPEDAKAPT